MPIYDKIFGWTASACYGNQNNGVMIAAASDPLWNNGAICGKKFRVTCTGATNPVPKPCTGNNVTVKIVDHCPGCGGTLDLSKEAFATIAKPVAGALNLFGMAISWNLQKSCMNNQESGLPWKIISFGISN
ncbi:hypothetical protein ACSBR1_025943 [Camellia fascicularis]